MDVTTTVTPVRAAPLFGLRVSWGALLAGALATLASSAILFLLGLAVVLVAMHPDQWAGASVALWIIGICCTLIGACIGGLVAGWLTGNGLKRIGGVHGFLSWGLSFLISLAFGLALFGGLLRFAGNTVVSTAQATAQAAGGAASAPAGVASKAVQTLEGLGYTPAEATRMVHDAQRNIQRSIRGANPQVAGQQAEATLSDALHYLGGAIWIYWGTWIVAMILSLLFGMLGSSWATRRFPSGEPLREPLPGEPFPGRPTPPLTPREV